MHKLFTNKEGNVNLILTAVVAAVVISVSIIIIFSIAGGFTYSTIDTSVQTAMGHNTSTSTATPATNASGALNTNLETFYTVSPIYIVVLAAVGIIAAIMMIVVKKR